MPFSPLHKRKFSKNMTMLIVLIVIVAGFFTMTMVKVGQ